MGSLESMGSLGIWIVGLVIGIRVLMSPLGRLYVIRLILIIIKGSLGNTLD